MKFIDLHSDKDSLEEYMSWFAKKLEHLPRAARRYILANERRLYTDMTYNPLRQIILLDREIISFLQTQEKKSEKEGANKNN